MLPWLRLVSPQNRSTTHTLGDSARRQITRWLAVAGWASVIFYLSSLSRLPPAVSTWSLTKLAHITEYAVLTLLLIRALDAHQLARARVLWLAAMLAVAYAASDEFHQRFVPNRHPSPLDILIDSIGISAATLFAASAYERRIRGVR